MTSSTRAESLRMRSRAADWRDGAIVYQAFVDRFAPSANLEAKRSLYAAPRTLHSWSEIPAPGRPVPGLGLWSHELAFWGGDLKSLDGKLDYIRTLGADVLYLNPIVPSLTNHKYDAQDWAQVAPEYGTRQDVADLARDLHQSGMKLMLDGAFNHMGKSSPKFQSALHDVNSPYRNWFFFGPQYPLGYRAWVNVPNLAEVRLENPDVQSYIWGSADSVVQKYLRDGVDGWRLDTAYELGPKFLGKLTQSAHRAKPGSSVVGEIWSYPGGWFPSLDGVMNFYVRTLIVDLLQGKIPPEQANRLLERLIADVGIDSLLKSWLVLDNHDTDRLMNMFPDQPTRRIAQVLQFTLPGCPVIYYGTEVGMLGGGDPMNRAPMRWDLVSDSNPTLQWTKKLITLRKSHSALRIGECVPLDTRRLVGFVRRTDKVMDTVVVLVNPTNEAIKETVSLRDGRIMSWGKLKDLLDGVTVSPFCGMIDVTVPPQTARVFAMQPESGYTPYKRIH